MFFRKRKPLFILVIIVLTLGIFTLYFQEVKEKELEIELSKVKLQNVRVGVGTSMGKLGTAIFGEIINNGSQSIKIATINIFFLSQSGEKIGEKKFFPVNNYSFSDSSPLGPGQSKNFGFPIDDLVPENWGGEIKAKLIDLKFK